MAMIIRPTYPLNFSIGLLLLIFVLSAFLSFEIFQVSWLAVMEGGSPVLGMALAGAAVVIMVLILWEEFLFPVRVKPSQDKIVFRNHFTKLRTQVLFYCAIPAIAAFIYLNYEVSDFWFLVWAAICMVSPLRKLFSGIRNHNDFLKLTNETVEYKNNDEEGVLRVTEIREIRLVRDESDILHKIQLRMQNNTEVIIDLDEMELEAYYQTIDEFVKGHYRELVT